MDSSLDSVDNVPYLAPEDVKPVERSKKEKRRKFSKALREKMEEDLEKRRRQRQGDELVLGTDDKPRGEDEQKDKQASDEQSSSTATPAGSPDSKDEDDDRHIDVKA
jgi:hypothetical protein